MTPPNADSIRKAVAKALNIKPHHLGCFTITDHDNQPMIILMHGGPYQGIHTEQPLEPKTLPLTLP